LIEESTAHTVVGYEPHETTVDQRTTSFSFSLQILAREGLSVRGDMTMQKTSVPQRASRPVDIEQEYDDDSVAKMPRSAIRFRSTQAQGPNTGPIQAQGTPVVTHRVSGTTRLLLYLVLVLCVLFLFNGIVWPVIVDIGNQLKYGDAQIATYDLDNHHFITQDDNGKVRIVVSSADNQHTQVLTTVVQGAGSHALVSLSEDGSNVDVNVAGTYVTSLVPDSHGLYKWKES